MPAENRKVVLHAVHSNDLEGVLMEIGSYDAITKGKMSCHFCYGPLKKASRTRAGRGAVTLTPSTTGNRIK